MVADETALVAGAVFAAMSLTSLYALYAGLGNPNRRAAHAVYLATWWVPSALGIEASALLLISANGLLSVALAAAALVASIGALALPPAVTSRSSGSRASVRDLDTRKGARTLVTVGAGAALAVCVAVLW
jgi:hypothetical protein